MGHVSASCRNVCAAEADLIVVVVDRVLVSWAAVALRRPARILSRRLLQGLLWLGNVTPLRAYIIAAVSYMP